MLGESEEVINELMDAYAEWKGSGKSRKEFLEAAADIPGVYVPSFYDVEYNEDGTVKEIKPNNPHAPKTIKKRIMTDFSNAFTPEKVIVPFGEVVHDRAVLEVFRGCIRGCRFCQAGYVYRPVRQRSADRLIDVAEKLLSSTGFDEISLSSLSTSDYTELPELTSRLLEITEKKKIKQKKD